MVDYASKLQQLQYNIAESADKAGRNPEDIKIVAVSKTRGVQEIEAVLELGINNLGENRVQEFKDKYDLLEERDISWHMVGHLQRNKVKYLMRRKRCTMIQSLDSLRLAKKIEGEAAKEERSIDVLVQVNQADDPNKYGFQPQEVLSFLQELKGFSRLRVRGLMTILPYVDDPEEVRPYFSQLSLLRDQIRAEKMEWINMDCLSMGMTNDYQVAIEEGATMIRIGTAIFGPRQEE